MSESPRDKSGRFASTTARESEPRFDLLASLQRLFTTAERAGDYAGCASLARVISDLERRGETPAQHAADAREADVLVEEMTDEEREQARGLLGQLRELKERVRTRLSGRS